MDDKNLHNDEMNFQGFPEPRVPADAAWADMKKILKPAPPKNLHGKAFPGSSFLYAGMGLLIAAALGYYLVREKKQQQSQKIIYYSQEKLQKDTLQNGTVIFLNKYSSISRNTNKNEESILFIKGSAYFENTKSAQQLPHLRIGALDVLPAKAAIYASFDTASTISSVHIQSGTAIVQGGGKRIVLNAGESIEFNEKEKLLGSKQPVNINLYSYATNIFDFTNTPLKNAAEAIEKAFGVTIVFENTNLYNCRITTRFDNKSLKEILDIMAYTLNFNYNLDEKNNRVTLTGNGCY